MRKIIKDPAPVFWTDFIHTHPRLQYKDLNGSAEGRMVRQQIREHMTAQQKYLCCYCCGTIHADNSHNEHVRSRDCYPNLSMDYTNLLVSCIDNTHSHCGMKKDNADLPTDFVSPLQDDCEEHFCFYPDGRIDGQTDQGKHTIDYLGLNDYALVDARKNLYNECMRMAQYMGKEYVYTSYMQENDQGVLPRYVDMVTYFYNRGDFDDDIVNAVSD